MPQVEVTEENIDRFGLVELTGNSREDMLSRAAEARMHGTVLAVNLPDDLIELNIFDVAPSSEPTPIVDQFSANNRCRYEINLDDPERKYICIIHGFESKHNPAQDPQAPCLGVDPIPQTGGGNE